MVATMKDVATAAGVSLKTVSNYFNGYQYMREETRDRIARAIADLDYRVNISARNLRAGKTMMLALVIPDLDQSYFAHLAQAVIYAADELGYTVLVETTSERREKELAIMSGSLSGLVDGVIYSPSALGSADVSEFDVDFPLVFLGERVFNGPADHVTMANVDASRAAIDHLLALGRRRIAIVGAMMAQSPSAATLRSHGCWQALHAAGIDIDPELIFSPQIWTRDEGAKAVHQLLRDEVEFDAVFAFTDAMALGALWALLTSGVTVPDEVAVVGFDNIEDARFAVPTLTTIDPGRDYIARTAVELLVERIAHPDVTKPFRSLVADYSLIVRDSTSLSQKREIAR